MVCRCVWGDRGSNLRCPASEPLAECAVYPNLGPPTSGGAPPPEPQPAATEKPPVLVVVASVLGPLGLGAVITALVLYFSANMRDRTHELLAHLRADRDADAWAMATPALQQQIPREAFPAWLDARVPGIRQSTGEWINGFSGGGGQECMEVWLHGDDLVDSTVYVILEDVDDVWRVADITYVELPMCDSD